MTAYKFNFDNAQEGMLADSSLRRTDSATAVPGIPFGKAVSLFTFGSTFEMSVVAYNNTAEVFGITEFTIVNTEGTYVISNRCSVLTFGRVWVKNNTLFPWYPGAPAYVDNNPVGGTMGDFTVLPTYGAGVGENNRRIGTFLSLGPANGGLGVLDFVPWLN